jgi:hypothetical protein
MPAAGDESSVDRLLGRHRVDVERLRIPLASEGDDLFLAEGRDGPQLDDLAFGEVFEVENRGLQSVRSGGRQ